MKFNNIFSPLDLRDYKATSVAKEEQLPEEFELPKMPVKNQKDVGACVAFAASELVEFNNVRQEGYYVEMSTGYIYGNRQNEASVLSSGYYARLAMKNLKEMGVPRKASFPQNVEMPEAAKLFNNRDPEIDKEAYKNRISSYFRVNDEETAKQIIKSGTPLLFCIRWDDDVYCDTDHILHFKSKTTSSGHCVLAVGWNKNGWIIQNSWGRCWGNKGRATVPYDAPIREIWGSTDDITHENLKNTIEIKKPNGFVKVLSQIIIAILKVLRNKK